MDARSELPTPPPSSLTTPDVVPPPAPPRRGHPVLRWIARIAGVVVVAVVLAVAVIVHNAVWFVDQHLDEVTAKVSEHFERKLTVGAVRGRVFPRVAVFVDGLTLESREKNAPPLLQLPTIEVRFDTWRAIRTLGKELHTQSVRVMGGTVHVRRDFDGEVDMADVAARLPPLDPKDIQGALLGEVLIHDVDVEYVDEPAMQVVKIRDLHLETHDAGLGRPFDAVLTATWVGPESPIALTVHVDEVPRDLKLWPFPPSQIDVAIDDVHVADAIATFGLPPSFDDGSVDVKVKVNGTGEHHVKVAVDIDGEATSMVVRSGTGAGVENKGVHGPVQVMVRADHDVDGGVTWVDALSVSIAGMHVDGKARIDALGVDRLEVALDVEQLARLGTVVPPLLTTAPGAFTIAGHAKGWFHLDNEDFSGDLDFDGARVAIGEALSKHPGERLRLALDGHRNVVPEFNATCGLFKTGLDFSLPRGARISGSLLVPGGEGDDTILDLASNQIPLGVASSISPVLNDLFGTEQPGALKARALGRIGNKRTHFDIDLALTQLGLGYDRTTAVGDADMSFDIHVDDSGLALGLDADGTKLAIQTKDEKDETIFAKDNTERLLLTAALREVGGRGSLGTAMATAGSNGDIVDGDGLVERWRRILNGLQGKVALQAAELKLVGVEITDLDLALGLRKGQLIIDNGELSVFDGRVAMTKTTAALTSSPAAWGLSLKATALSAKQLLAPIRRFSGAVSGTIDIEAKLAAAGLSVGSVLQSLDGPVTVSTHNVHLHTLDVISGWIDNVWNFIGKIPGVDPKEFERARSQGISSTIADGSWTMHFKRDQFLINEPVVVDTNFGQFRVDGSAGFDGKIDFDAHLGLFNEQLQTMHIVDDKPLDLRVGVTGTWDAPVFSADNFDILRTAIQQRLDEAVKKVMTDVRSAADSFQHQINLEVVRAQRSVEQTLGIDAAGHSKVSAGTLESDGTSAIGDADIDTRPIAERGLPPTTTAPTTTAPPTTPSPKKTPEKKKAPTPSTPP